VDISCCLYTGAFSGEDVTHVEGEVDPVRDLGIISEELRQKVRVIHNLKTVKQEVPVLVFEEMNSFIK